LLTWHPAARMLGRASKGHIGTISRKLAAETSECPDDRTSPRSAG
jgi:hypothetical protein